MTHYMNLVPSAFKKIADGSKTIELRLNDEKRQKIKNGDTVAFSCSSNKDIITAQVFELHKFSDFKELYNALPLEKCGYTVAELDTAHYNDMEQYYTKEQIKEYIAVKPEYRGQGIGSKLIDFIFDRFNAKNVTAETDENAIEFYKKYGFIVADTKVEFDTKRYVCVCESITHHYDLLIAENNDPVHDPKSLRDYMDKWDGQVFIDKMELDKENKVLEIGVGTGRLAVRVAPLCGKFFGIDISPKTINRAKENLNDFENITLICEDFLKHNFNETFDVIYSSLTFMHIKEKQTAINKVSALLKGGGKFVLSIDTNQDVFIDTGTRKITVLPDTPEEIKTYIANSGLLLLEHYETEFAHIFVAKKECKCYCGHDCSRCVTYIATQL